MHEVGFMDEKLTHFQIDKISVALNDRWNKYQGYSFPYKDEKTLTPKIKKYLEKFWRSMKESGRLEEVHEKKEKELGRLESCVTCNSLNSINLGKIGPSWLLLQFLEKIEFREFLRKIGFSEIKIYSAVSCIIAFTATASTPKTDYDFDYKDFLKDTALCYLMDALARDEGYKRALPTYEEIISVPEKLLAKKSQLEVFFFSVINKLCPTHETSLKSPTSSIVDFETFKSNGNLNKIGRHRAAYLESFMKELYLGNSSKWKDQDWYTANLFVGWISYVISFLIRNVLKKSGITLSWNNILSEFDLQTLAKFTGRNYKGKELSTCICAEPSSTAQNIYRVLEFECKPPFEFSCQNESV